MTLPGAGQLLVAAATACAAWLFWTESRDRGWIPGVVPRPVDEVTESLKAETFDSLELPGAAELICALSDTRDPAVRRKALLQLSSIGPDAAEAIDAIRARLKDEHDGVRYAAVLTLWRVSRDPEVVMPELPAMLGDRSGGVREVTTETFAAIGKPATGLVLTLLNSDSPTVRSQAVSILQRIVCPETFAEIRDAIERVCRDPDPDVRTAALVACMQFGSTDVPKIRELLQTNVKVPPAEARSGKNRDSRDVALEAIAWLGPEAADLVPDLLTLLGNIPEWEVKSSDPQAISPIPVPTLEPRVQSILHTLRAMQTSARPAIPFLLGRFADSNRRARLAMIGTLIDIGADPQAFTPFLIAGLAEIASEQASPGSPATLQAACHEAFEIARWLATVDSAEAGRQASLAIPKLADQSKPIDHVAMSTLKGLGPEARKAVPLLISMLDRGGRAMYHATEVLRNLGPDAAPAVPSLIAILEQTRGDGKTAIRSDIFEALGKIGPAAAPAVPVLIDILEQAQIKGKIRYHRATVDALGNIGPAAASAVPLLLTLLDEPEPTAPPADVIARGEQPAYSENRENVLSALGKIASDSPEVQSAIRQQLASKSILRRAVAVHALDASRRFPEIIEILQNDTSGFVRAHAVMAITAMSGDRVQAVAPLVEALGDSDADVRKMAAIALGSMGPAMKSALPMLRQALLEARCGIPGAPLSGPSQTPLVLRLDYQEIPELPLPQALRQAIAAIDREE